jgi:hypothetical protein
VFEFGNVRGKFEEIMKESLVPFFVCEIEIGNEREHIGPFELIDFVVEIVLKRVEIQDKLQLGNGPCVKLQVYIVGAVLSIDLVFGLKDLAAHFSRFILREFFLGLKIVLEVLHSFGEFGDALENAFSSEQVLDVELDKGLLGEDFAYQI